MAIGHASPFPSRELQGGDGRVQGFIGSAPQNTFAERGASALAGVSRALRHRCARNQPRVVQAHWPVESGTPKPCNNQEVRHEVLADLGHSRLRHIRAIIRPSRGRLERSTSATASATSSSPPLVEYAVLGLRELGLRRPPAYEHRTAQRLRCTVRLRLAASDCWTRRFAHCHDRPQSVDFLNTMWWTPADVHGLVGQVHVCSRWRHSSRAKDARTRADGSPVSGHVMRLRGSAFVP